MRHFLVVLLLLWSGFTKAEHCRNILKGQILDKEHKTALAYSNIFIKELKDGAVADEKGYFEIKDLCDGIYTLRISHVGCKPVELSLSVFGNIDTVIYLNHNAEVLDLVEISAKRQNQALSSGGSKIEVDEHTNTSVSLAESLSKIPGLSIRSAGAGVQKPTIHGLTGSRIAIVKNGVQHEAQQWGDDHAPEIVSAAYDNITLVKGVNTLALSSNASGGAIIMEQSSGPSFSGQEVRLGQLFQSNGRGLETKLRASHQSKGANPFSFTVGYSQARQGNLKNARRYLSNTGTQDRGMFYAVAKEFKKGRVQVDYSQYQAKRGIFEGAHVGNLSDLQRIFERGYALAPDSFSYTIGRPYQDITHEQLNVRSEYNLGEHYKAKLWLSRQYNLRMEFDKDRDDAMAHFEKTSHQAQFQLNGFFEGWSFQTGVLAKNIQSTTEGAYFVPEYAMSSLAAHFLASKRWKGWLWSAGARAEYLEQELFNIRPLKNEDRTVNINPVSYQLGADKQWNSLSINIMHGYHWRLPEVNERFAQGLHHGLARVELGDPNLGLERSFNNSVDLNYQITEQLQLRSYTYYNWYPSYVYLKGEAQPELTIRGAFPVMRYQQSEATHRGLDLSLRYILPRHSFELTYSTVSIITEDQGFDLLLPANEYKLNYKLGFLENQLGLKELSMSANLVEQQRRLPDYLSSETTYFTALSRAPEAYSLIDLKLTGRVSISSEFELYYFLEGKNLFNTLYQSYTDTFRFYSSAMGRTINLGLTLKFKNQINKPNQNN